MNKILILPFLLLAACATRPADRTEAQTNYLDAERGVQESSQERAERTSRVTALAARVRALDSQIATQRLVVARWEGMKEVASAPAMIKNAKMRIKQLSAEKEALVREQAAEIRQVNDLNNELNEE